MKSKQLLLTMVILAFANTQAIASTSVLPADSVITAVTDNYSVCASSPSLLSPFDNDIIGSDWSNLTITLQPTQGSAIVTGDKILYTPYLNLANTDSLKYQFTYGSQDYQAMIYINLISPGVTVSSDMSICTEGGSVGLWASGADFYEWTPSTGLSDTTIANPTASPTQTTTYTVTGYNQIFTSSNLVYNGNFSYGNVGFITNYSYNSNLWDEGTYYVGPSAALYHTGFYGYDHTSGSGNFMIINGSTGTNITAWSTTITVQPNTDYAFSAWVCNVCVSCMGDTSQMAHLQFSINGEQLGGIFSPSPFPGGWEQFYQIWNSGDNTQAVITLLSQSVAAAGNDFGIDDISFAPVLICPFTDSVTVYVGSPDIVEVSDSVCDVLEWNGIYYNESGDYVQTLQNTMGCDSTVTMHLTVLEQPVTDTYDTICYGNHVTFNGQDYYGSGVYADTLSASSGCDSISRLNLYVIPMEQIDYIYGEPNMEFANDLFTGKYDFHINPINDCDSVVWRLGGHTNWVFTSNPEDMFMCTIICLGPGHDTLFVSAYANGCDTHAFIVLSGSGAALDESLSESISVGPNPSSGDMTIDFGGLTGSFAVTVFNSHGTKLDKFEHQNGGSVNYNMDGMANGVYFISISGDKGTAIKKVVLMR